MTDRLMLWLALACGVVCFIAGWTFNGWRLEMKIAEEHAQLAQANVAAEQAAREAEHRVLEGLSQASAKYEKERNHAEQTESDTVARLRADNLRLRQQWRGCALPQVAPRAAEPDDAAQLRIEGAGRIVRAAAECDAQVRGLQSALTEERVQ